MHSFYISSKYLFVVLPNSFESIRLVVLVRRLVEEIIELLDSMISSSSRTNSLVVSLTSGYTGIANMWFVLFHLYSPEIKKRRWHLILDESSLA